MIKKLFGSQLRLNMASGVVATVISTVAMAIAYPIYLHFLDYEIYGLWLVLATVLSFAQLGNLGIDQAIMKLVAEEHGRGDIEGIQRYVTTALALLCLSGTVALILILALKNPIIAAFNLSDENAKVVAWLLPYIGILSIYVFIVQALNATLSGLGRMDLANYTQSIGRIVAVGVAATLLYSGRGIESLLIGNALSYLCVHIMSLSCIRRTAHIRFLQIGNLDAQRGKRLLCFGGGVFGGSLISMLFSPFNKLMLSRYAGVSTIPIYEIAYTGSMQVRGLIEAGLRALMPEVSRLNGITTQEARDRIIQIYRRAMRLIFVTGIPIYGVLFILSPLLLRFWLGDRFVETLPNAFRIMLISSFVSLFGALVYYVIMGFGRIRYLIVTNCIGAGTSCLLVTAYYVITRSVSVNSIGFCGIAANAAALIYLVRRATDLLASDTNQFVSGEHSLPYEITVVENTPVTSVSLKHVQGDSIDGE